MSAIPEDLLMADTSLRPGVTGVIMQCARSDVIMMPNGHQGQYILHLV